MAELSGPYSREVEDLDRIADILLGEDDLADSTGNRRADALARFRKFIEGEGSGKYKNVQSDWNADPSSQAAILNKPDGIPVDPDYVHTDENFTRFHREKLENIETMAEVNVQSDWTETDPESDAYIRNVPGDLVRDADYVHTDNNLTDELIDKLVNHVITDEEYTGENSEKLASIEWNATHTDIETEIDEYSSNPVESAAIYAALAGKVDKAEGYALSKNDFTDELKAKLDAIEAEATHTDIDSAMSLESANPVENRVVQAALDTKVDKVEGQALSDENYTRAEKVKLEGIEAQANRTIPDDTITASSRNVVESRAIYEALDTKVNKISGKGLSTEDFTTTEKNKLAGIEANATNTIVDAYVSGSSENPVRSRAIYDELLRKVDKIEGWGLSENNFSDEDKIRLAQYNPNAPKTTIARVIENQQTGDLVLNMTWKQCKDAISNGVLYYLRTSGETENVVLCYSAESEFSDGTVVYRVEFADFDNAVYEYFKADSADSYPTFVGNGSFQPDMTVKVDKTTAVNGHTLDQDVTITPNDIAYSHTTEFDPGTVGFGLNHLRQNKADKATQINGHTLEDDVTIDAGDIDYSDESTYAENSIGEKLWNLETGKVDKVDGYALSKNDFTDALKEKLDTRAPLDSPNLAGTPTAPTAVFGTDTTQLATTAFVQAAAAVKANASDVYTKAQIDSRFASVYRLKGAKDAITDLPQEDNTTGDVWHVNADGSEYFWNGSDWELFGKIVDLTGYVYDPDYVHTDNNLTSALKAKLENIEAGSQANVNADWTASSGDAQILNKPKINNVELIGGNNTLQSLGIDIATEQDVDALFE